MVSRLSFGLAIVIILTALGCGGGGYDDFVEVNTKFIDAMEVYLQDIDGAQDAQDVAAAMDRYAEKIESLAPEMKETASKYHTRWTDESQVPEDVKALQEKSEAVAAKIPDSFMKAMKYMMDAQVQEAQMRLQQAMTKMQ